MNYKKLTAPLVLLFIVCFRLGAQNGNYSLRNVIPPSPTVASLGKYGEIPVSLYTGVPNISIPLYEIKDGPLSLPISLSYHAGGIKVEELASNVGLGWTLNAGGIVGRQIRGRPDETGWITDATHRIAYILQNGTQDQKNQISVEIENGSKDGEPDIYYYNFGTQTGKFLFDQAGTLHNYPIRNISVTPGVGGWNIITEDGTVYEFGKSEVVTTTTCTGGDGDATTAWFLTKITSNDGKREITFTYENITYWANEFLGETRYFPINGYGGCLSSDIVTCSGSNVFNTQVLKRIDFLGGYVKFNYNNVRQDLLPGTSKSLDQIEIYTSTNELIKKYDLAYSYFNPGSSNPDDTRLKLLSLTEKSATNQKPPYTFTYEESVQLPVRGSTSTDHWGYYNGKNNTTHIATFNYTNINGDPLTFYGADKTANPATMQAGILKKIQYPAGGETNFTYEANTTSDERVPAATYTQNYSYGQNAPYSSLSSPYETSSFTIPSQGADVKFSVSGIAVSSSQCSYEVNLHCYLIKDNNVSNPVLTITDAANNGHFQLSGGTYKFRFTFDPCNMGSLNFSIGLEANIPILSEMGKRPVGGLRIKQVEDKPGNGGQSVIKKYRYEDELDATKSSGVLVNFPEYGYNLTAFKYWNVPGPYQICQLDQTCVYVVKQSKTNYPLATTQGSYVGYSHVIEDLEDNGEIRHKYNISSFANTSFPFPPVETYEWEQGSETATKFYAKKNGQFVLSKEISYGYYYSNPEFVTGYVVGRDQIYTGDCAPLYGPAPMTTYSRFPRFYVLNHINERQYDQNDPTKYVERVTDYTFNTTHYQLAQVRASTSSGDAAVRSELVAIKKYPQDYSFTGSPSGTEAIGIKKLQDLHIVNVPIEDYTYRQKRNISTNAISDQRVISGIINTFKSDNPYPAEVFRLETNATIPLSTYGSGSAISSNAFVKNTNSTVSSAFKSAVIFSSYDVRGNLTQQQKANDIITSYLWGYQNKYPVAEIVGADYATAMGYVGDPSNLSGSASDELLRTVINNVRIGLASTKAQVTTYTYKRLVGINGVTDPNNRTSFYEFDDFGRLSLVRDQDYNIIKKYCYNYFGQPENCVLYSNTDQSGNYYSQNCLSGQTPLAYYVSIPAGTFTSTISVQDANTQALQYAQNQANVYGTCYSPPPQTTVYLVNSTGETYIVTLVNVTTYQTWSQTVYGFTNPTLTVPVGNYNVTVYPTGTSYPTYFNVLNYSSYGTQASVQNASVVAGNNFIGWGD